MKMNTFINNIYTMIAILVVLTAVIAFIYMLQLQKKNKLSYLVGDDKWTFNDWANPLTSITAGLGLIITIAQNNAIITGLSLICGATILIIPTAYNTLCRPKGTAWAFLIFSTLILWTAIIELVAAAWLADDDTITKIPSGVVHTFRILMYVAAAIVLFYYARTANHILKNQIFEPAKQSTFKVKMQQWLHTVLVALHLQQLPEALSHVTRKLEGELQDMK
jgi:hypothetical protein